MFKFLGRIFRSIINFFRRLFGWRPPAPPTPNQAPVAQILSPSGPVQEQVLALSYRLLDAESDPVTITVVYRIAGGNWLPASPALQDNRHEGTQNLSSSPTGIDHLFIWDWQQDIRQPNASQVQLAITPADATQIGQQVLSVTFDLSTPPPPNQAPTVQINAPLTDVRDQVVLIDYTVIDVEADAVDVQVSYQLGTAAAQLATPKSTDPRHDGIQQLATSAAGISHQFVWDWQQDVGQPMAQAVQLSIIVHDGYQMSMPATAGPINISLPAPPPPPPNQPPQVNYISPDTDVIDQLILINYELSDAEADPTDVTVQYSLGGTAWLPATAAIQDPRHQGSLQLNTSAQGINYQYVWDWQQDIPQPQVSDVRIRIMARDAGSTGTPVESPSINLQVPPPPPPPPPNQPPVVQLQQIPAVIQSNRIAIDYTLADAESDLATVEARYRVAGAAPLVASPMPADSRHSGVQQLSTSPTGEQHTFVWDWQQDLGQAAVDDVVFYLQASDAQGTGAEVGTQAFRLEPPPPPPNHPPQVSILAPLADQVADEVLIEYMLADTEGDLCSVEIHYAVGGSAFLPVSPLNSDPRHEDTQGLQTDATGILHRFVWDWLTDLGQNIVQDVVIKITPHDGQAAGQPDQVGPFDLEPLGGVPPQLSIQKPTGGLLQPPVTVDFTIVHQQGALFSLMVHFSLDGGQTFQSASPHSQSGPTTDLASSLQGTTHQFIWDVEADIPNPALQDVLLELEISGGGFTISETSLPFDVELNYPPIVDIWNPNGGLFSSPVTIDYVLTDRESNPVDLTAEYSIAGGAFMPATSHSSSGPMMGVPTDAFGQSLQFIWDAAIDLGSNRVDDIVFRITANDGVGIGSDDSAPFSVGAPVPAIVLRSPHQGVYGTPVPVLFLLSDPIDSTVQVEMFYSLDLGQTYLSAKAAPGIGLQNLTAVATSPTGVTHFFAWDALADLGTLPEDEVILRIKATNSQGFSQVNSPLFDVSLLIPGAPPIPPLPPTASTPQIHNLFKAGAYRQGLVPLRFTLSDEDMKPTNILVEYDDGSGFKPATAAPMSDSMIGLAAPDIVMDHRFVWDARRDLGLMTTDQQVTMRMTPWVADKEGTPVTETVTVQVRDKPAVPAPENVISRHNPVLTIEEGDQQTGVGGLFLPEYLKVKVEGPDDQGNLVPLSRVRLSFVADGPQGLGVSFEEEGYWGMTTNYDGIAMVRVKTTEVSSPQNFQIKVTVAGAPQSNVTFQQAVSPGVIVPHSNNPAEVHFGGTASLSFFVDADNDPATERHFMPLVTEPVKFRVQVVNGIIDEPKPQVPVAISTQLAYAGSIYASFRVAPTGSTGTVDLIIDVPDLPQIQPLQVSVPVRFDFAARRRNSYNTTSPNPYDPVYLKFSLENDSYGYYNTDEPQVGFPGLTLARPFRVKLTDELDRPYHVESTHISGNVCNAPPTTQKLELTWSGQNLEFATSPNGQRSGYLLAAYDEEVYVTPTGHGPWVVSVRYISGLDRLQDPHKRVFQGTNSNGDPWCFTEHALAGNGTYSHSRIAVGMSFIIREGDLALIDRDTFLPVKKLRTGMRVQFQVTGLSSWTGTANLGKVRLQTFLPNGNSPGSIQGMQGKYNEEYNLSTFSTAEVRSEEIRLITGGAAVPTGNTLKLHSILPNAYLLASTHSFFATAITLQKERRRLLVGDSEKLQEAPGGASVRSGYRNTVEVHSGEFHFSRCDLTFNSREEPLKVCRSYRSMVQSLHTEEEPLGPGWFLSTHPMLSTSGLIRWWQSGRVADLLGAGYSRNSRPKGFFLTLTRNSNTDATNSPYELRLASDEKIHFYEDGSLRFWEYRNGDQVEYQYNDKGQLVRILDPMDKNNRWIAFEYNDQTSNEALRNRLIRVSDFTGRTVEYEYYPIADPKGGEGWLKTVTHSACPTMGGGDQPDLQYQRSETYEYEPDPQLGWRLKRILNSDQDAKLINHYQNGQITRQEPARSIGDTRSFLFNYSTSNQTTTTDLAGTQRVYQYPSSPYWDATCARETVHDPSGANSRSLARFNHDGLMVYLESANRDKYVYIYDFETWYVRSAGNLLAVIHTPRPATSVSRYRDRVMTMQYERIYNEVISMVMPEGNHPKSDPALFTRRNYYDNTGNLIETRAPRVLNAYRKTDGGVRWIEESPSTYKQYSASYQRLIREEDAMGIVTTYEYYPATDPGGLGGGNPSTDGGGFLARVVIDAEDTAARQLRLGSTVPLEPRAMQMYYNAVGDLVREIWHQGSPMEVTREYEVNILHERNKLIRAVGTPHAITSEAWFDAEGRMAYRTLTQTGAGNLAGGDTLPEKWEYDWQGNIRKHHERVYDMQAGSFKWITKELEYHPDDQIHRIKPPHHQHYPQAVQEFEWDTRGYLKSEAVGASQINYDFTSQGRTRELSNPGGNKQTFHQDTFGEQEGLVDERGNISTVDRDTQGKVIRKTVQHGHVNNANRSYPNSTADHVSVQETRYDEQGKPRRSHDTKSIIPSSVFGAPSGGKLNGPVTDFIGFDLPPLPPVYSYEDDSTVAAGNARSTADQLYNSWQIPTRLTNDEAGYIWYRHSPHKEEIEMQSFTGNETLQQFDAAGNRVNYVEKTIYRDAGTTVRREYRSKTDYDLHGRAVRIVDGLGNALSTEYDETGFSRKTWDAMGPDSGETYNNQPVNSPGNLSEYFRDAQSQLIRLERHLNTGGTSAGNPEVTQYNPDAKTIRHYEYRAEGGPLIAFIDQAGYRIENEYRPDGQLLNLHRWTEPGKAGEDRVTNYSYLANTSLVEYITDPNGSQLQFYFGDYYITGIEATLPATMPPNSHIEGATSYTVRYDGAGNIEFIKDDISLHEVHTARDTEGRVTREKQGNHLISSNYQAHRSRSLNYALHGSITYRYDREKRLEKVEEQGLEICYLRFNGDGRLRQREHGSLRIDFGADEVGRPLSLTASFGNEQIIFDMERDRMGRIKRLTRTQATQVDSWLWDYDSVGRIVREQYTPAGGTMLTGQFHYDGDDILRKMDQDVANGAPISIEQERGQMGMITHRNGQRIYHDYNGNLSEAGGLTYFTDPWNRLLRIENASGTIMAEYDYDGHNRLTRRVAGGIAEDYLYDDWQLIEVLDANTQTAKERFIFSDQTDDLMYIDIGNDRYKVLIGPTGNVDCLLNAQNQLVERYVYTLFGAVTVLDASGQVRNTKPLSRFLYKCRPYDPETQLYQFRMRWYDPATGCFLSPDPAGYNQGPNHYSLCNGDPINKTDPMGTEEEESVVGAWFSGFAEGLGIGATALVNEGAKTLSFGFYEKDVIEVAPEDRRIYNYAKIPARIGTEAAFAALTLGVGTAVKAGTTGAQVIANAPRAVRFLGAAVQNSNRVARTVGGMSRMLRTGEIAQSGRDLFKGYAMAQAGNRMGWVMMAAGGMGMPVGTIASTSLRTAAIATQAVGTGAAVLTKAAVRRLSSLARDAYRMANPNKVYVYRLWQEFNPVPVYIGISTSPFGRSIRHQADKGFDFIEEMTVSMSKSDAEMLESMLIHSHLIRYGKFRHANRPAQEQLALAGLFNKKRGEILPDNIHPDDAEDLMQFVVERGARNWYRNPFKAM